MEVAESLHWPKDKNRLRRDTGAQLNNAIPCGQKNKISENDPQPDGEAAIRGNRGPPQKPFRLKTATTKRSTRSRLRVPASGRGSGGRRRNVSLRRRRPRDSKTDAPLVSCSANRTARAFRWAFARPGATSSKAGRLRAMSLRMLHGNRPLFVHQYGIASTAR